MKAYLVNFSGKSKTSLRKERLERVSWNVKGLSQVRAKGSVGISPRMGEMLWKPARPVVLKRAVEESGPRFAKLIALVCIY